jgi:uncharacterized membrane protein (DUF485 family)
VLCSAYARDFMAKKVVGNVNVALVFGLLQFVSTFGIALAYGRYANRRLDPLAEGLRASVAAVPGARSEVVDTVTEPTDPTEEASA